jgi:hypothetical protein
MALLAAMTVGQGQFERLRAHVSAEVTPSAESYRLVVHSYDPASVDGDGRPARNVRPLGSAQRAVTADELARGVLVNVMQVGESMAKNPVVVAWVEPGHPTLELDALTARPAPGAAVAVSRADGPAPVQLVLRRG